MRIYLIGLPGVGKSSVGKALAEKIGYTFIDLDTYIEQQAMLFVDEIFHLYGEEYFRALETNCLKEVSSNENIVVSCGGGIIKARKNKEYMDGACIYLKANLDTIQARIDAQTIERPLLVSKKLEDLYLERKNAYEEFKTMEIENLDLNETVNTIIKELELK
ncbi:MAG: shikimate kinase [Anaeroplasmataceae bacterium]|nr:shikimate kinase [Anaeroplasmataceae bacterium]MDE6413801.1 shikimate kinase [Anaeroplasmataceae bacterium]